MLPYSFCLRLFFKVFSQNIKLCCCIQQSPEVQASQHVSPSQNLTSSLCKFSAIFLAKPTSAYTSNHGTVLLKTISNTTYYYISTVLKESLFQIHNGKGTFLFRAGVPFSIFSISALKVQTNNNTKVISVSRQIIWISLRIDAHFDCTFSTVEILKPTKIDSFRIISPGSSSDEAWQRSKLN